MASGTRRILAAALAVTAVLVVPATTTTSGVAASAAVVAASGPMVSATAVARRLKRKQRVTFIDTRDAVDGETIAGAVVAPPYVIEAWAGRARKTDYIVAYCTCEDDGLAIQAVETLRRLGFTNAWVLEGGLDAARAAGIPMGRPAM